MRMMTRKVTSTLIMSDMVGVSCWRGPRTTDASARRCPAVYVFLRPSPPRPITLQGSAARRAGLLAPLSAEHDFALRRCQWVPPVIGGGSAGPDDDGTCALHGADGVAEYGVALCRAKPAGGAKSCATERRAAVARPESLLAAATAAKRQRSAGARCRQSKPEPNARAERGRDMSARHRSRHHGAHTARRRDARHSSTRQSRRGPDSAAEMILIKTAFGYFKQ
jgi:hypothetical protein